MSKSCMNSDCSVSSLCSKIAEFGYSDSVGWIAALLFARNIVASFSTISSEQKEAAQKVVFAGLSAQDHSPDGFAKVVNGIESIIVDNGDVDVIKSELSLYKGYCDSMAESLAAFISDCLVAGDSRNKQILDFENQALEALNPDSEVNVLITRLRSLVKTILNHYKDEARVWEEKATLLERVVNVDPMLNSLHNRRALDNHLNVSIDKARLTGASFSLLMIDIDDFKNTINDLYGHNVGDDVLRTLAKILTQLAATNNFFAARYGGDELVVVCNMPGEEAQVLADVIRYSVQSYEFRPRLSDRLSSERIYFTVSIGVAEYHGDWTAEDLLAAADQAMYDVKRHGKNNVSRFCVVGCGC